MKKIVILTLVCVMLLSLCACGGDNTETPTGTTENTAPETTAPQITAPSSESQQTESAPADKKALAMGCIDKSVDELYALVGEPDETDYVPSCLMEGEDGMLIYDDFIVYTYRLDGEETVVDVE